MEGLASWRVAFACNASHAEGGVRRGGAIQGWTEGLQVISERVLRYEDERRGRAMTSVPASETLVALGLN